MWRRPVAMRCSTWVLTAQGTPLLPRLYGSGAAVVLIRAAADLW